MQLSKDTLSSYRNKEKVSSIVPLKTEINTVYVLNTSRAYVF